MKRISRIFSSWKSESLTIKQPLPGPLGSPIPLSHFMKLPWAPHVNVIRLHWSFPAWLISPNITSSRFMRALVYDSFLPSRLSPVPLCGESTPIYPFVIDTGWPPPLGYCEWRCCEHGCASACRRPSFLFSCTHVQWDCWSQAHSILHVLMNLFFNSSCASLQSHLQHTRFPTSSHPRQHLLPPGFLTAAVLLGARCYLIMVLTSISWRITDVDHTVLTIFV